MYYSAVVCPSVKPWPSKEAVTLSLERYRCDHARRGRCVIINNHHFNRLLTSQSDRDGTEVDATAVESLFVSLGFEVMRYDDLTVNDMSINLREGIVAIRVFTVTYQKLGCFGCFLQQTVH